jgi:hypothetical protein
MPNFLKIARDLKIEDIKNVRTEDHLVDTPEKHRKLVEVQMIGAYEFDKAIFGEEWPDWDTQCKVLKAFMETHPNAHYYGRPNEDFFIFEAVQEAYDKGKDVIILDNMS